MDIIVIGAIVWWTFAVAALAVICSAERITIMMFGIAVCWPLLIPVMIIALPYRAVVQSAKTIRTDIRNRKLMREFDEFLATKKGKISSKDDTP